MLLDLRIFRYLDWKQTKIPSKKSIIIFLFLFLFFAVMMMVWC